MTREQLEHIIRASAKLTDQYDIMVFGSQAILGADPNPPDVFTASMEADVYPLAAPELAAKIEGAIGEFSDFHNKNGYYAEGIDPEVALLPGDWKTRVNKIQNENTSGYAGYCLDVLDLFLAKAAAGRDKDREFCIALLQHRYLTAEEAIQKVPLMEVESRPEFGLTSRVLLARIRRWAKDAAIE